MGFFEKVLANGLGIGGWKIETTLDNSNVTPGDRITGKAIVHGGKIQQRIEKIDLELFTFYERESDDRKITCKSKIQKISIPVNQVLYPGDTREFDIDFRITPKCPITTQRFPVWLGTELEIDNAVDNNDKEYLTVTPNKYVSNILKGMESLGFVLREVENSYSYHTVTGLEFEQEFEFVPRTGEFRKKFDEIELFFSINGETIDLLMEVDRRARGFNSLVMEALDLDESRLRYNVSNTMVNTVDMAANYLVNILRNVKDLY